MIACSICDVNLLFHNLRKSGSPDAIAAKEILLPPHLKSGTVEGEAKRSYLDHGPLSISASRYLAPV